MTNFPPFFQRAESWWVFLRKDWRLDKKEIPARKKSPRKFTHQCFWEVHVKNRKKIPVDVAIFFFSAVKKVSNRQWQCSFPFPAAEHHLPLPLHDPRTRHAWFTAPSRAKRFFFVLHHWFRSQSSSLPVLAISPHHFLPHSASRQYQNPVWKIATKLPLAKCRYITFSLFFSLSPSYPQTGTRHTHFITHCG